MAALALALTLSALCHTADCFALDLANWMGQLMPLMGPGTTVLDLSLPGTHDSMTFDLSTDLSDGFEGLGPLVSDLLHAVTPIIAGGFIREQGQTQGLNMTQQLDAGIRFIDFRTMYSSPPSPIGGGVRAGPKDWFGLHGCQTRHTSLSFLQQARSWLDAHPKEIIVVWSSRHGDTRLTGADQYPATTPAIRQAYWKQIATVFDGMLFDASAGTRLNETSVQTLLRRGQRVVWYAADWKEFTGADPRAMDNIRIDNQLPSSGDQTGALGLFRGGAATRASNKASNSFFLASLANSGPSCQVEAAALVKFLPIDKKGDIARCAACYGVPGVHAWCPLTLMDVGLFGNYYNQRMLDAAFTEAATNPAVDFPNAIYIDVVDQGGLIRTGTSRVNPLGAGDDHTTTGYAYAATLIGQNVRRLCRSSSPRPAKEACDEATVAVETARAKHPLTVWNDTEAGRLSGWPLLPSA